VRTPLCDLLGIEHPIVQAPFGLWTSAELVAEVSNAGGLGSLGASQRPLDDLRRQLERVRELTDRPFAVNHVARSHDEEAVEATLAARPKVMSYATGEAGDLVERAHAAGSLFMQQVGSVQEATQAAERGVDVVIAQGSESGGYGGFVSALALVPQVVDAVAPIPVIAAGGVADGRGLAAVLMLGAQGVNIGTRFVASNEALVDDEWKRAIVAAASEDAVKLEFWNSLMPVKPGMYETLPRALRTPFVDEWNARREDAEREAESLLAQVRASVQERRSHEFVPFTGQSAGLIQEVLPAAEIVARFVAEAEAALERVRGLPAGSVSPR
jgi:enoyl-[acyl-carrier protein] reductase II